MSGGTFVAGTYELVTVPLFAVIDGMSFTLQIHSAIITFDRTSPAVAENGVIAGVLDVGELTAVFQRVAGSISPSLCGEAFAGIATQIAQTTDIRLDRTNPPGVPCNGISIGIGFHARMIANPSSVSPPTAVTHPCDGGSE